MSQDKVADVLNMMLNAKKAGKNIVETRDYSKVLLSVLAIAKMNSYVKEYRVENGVLKIELGSLNGCKAIKPRFTVSASEIDKYLQRYLPARNIGFVIISTSQGLMTHKTAIERNIGGSLIAYIF